MTVVTGTPEKGVKWREQYGLAEDKVYNYQNFDKIIDDPSIDVVYIVLPNSMHHEFTLRAAKAGKHVFCEKPMANSAKDCREMIAACEAANRQLGIGYRCQFEPHQACFEGKFFTAFDHGEKPTPIGPAPDLRW